MNGISYGNINGNTFIPLAKPHRISNIQKLMVFNGIILMASNGKICHGMVLKKIHMRHSPWSGPLFSKPPQMILIITPFQYHSEVIYVREDTLPWAAFRFWIFSNYFSQKLEKIKITVWKCDNYVWKFLYRFVLILLHKKTLPKKFINICISINTK